ncbi:DNA starvation/stationary phase protection protein [Rhodobacterales bacterium HKCCE2091]|nr:DNA starvation/stationary phase protection protein [Rhodobacterales bacterium HKCCE2091]
MSNTAAELTGNSRAAIVDALNQSLADTIAATMLSQCYHWNVKGPNFRSLHLMFEEIYTDHFAAQDELAERARALDGLTIGRLKDVLDRTSITEGDAGSSADDMVNGMIAAEEELAKSLAKLADVAAENDDNLTEDLAIARGQVHEKFAWMLRATRA